MSRYEVELVRYPETFEVEANSVDEAIAKAKKACGFSVYESSAEKVDK